jgi:hypothetical protein
MERQVSAAVGTRYWIDAMTLRFNEIQAQLKRVEAAVGTR